MIFPRRFLIVPAILLAGCANHEGKYEPFCTAFEGDTIELSHGRFSWQRFTDERIIDAAGNVVDPFPGYPKTGSYRIRAGRLELVSDDNVRLEDWFIVELAGHRYLLNAEQHRTFRDGGELPKCVLKLSGDDSR